MYYFYKQLKMGEKRNSDVQRNVGFYFYGTSDCVHIIKYDRRV